MSGVTEKDFMEIGFDMVNKHRFSNRKSYEAKAEEYKTHFGCKPCVAHAIWRNLLSTDIPEAKLDHGCEDPKRFLWAFHYLKKYPVETEFHGLYGMNRNDAREWIWYFLYKIAALRASVLAWPDEWTNKEKELLISVDGIHFWTCEPHASVPNWLFSKKNFSWKWNHAGVSYEIGVHLTESRIVWFSGPYPAGSTNDNGMYRHKNAPLFFFLARLKTGMYCSQCFLKDWRVALP